MLPQHVFDSMNGKDPCQILPSQKVIESGSVLCFGEVEFKTMQYRCTFIHLTHFTPRSTHHVHTSSVNQDTEKNNTKLLKDNQPIQRYHCNSEGAYRGISRATMQSLFSGICMYVCVCVCLCVGNLSTPGSVRLQVYLITLGN